MKLKAFLSILLVSFFLTLSNGHSFVPSSGNNANDNAINVVREICDHWRSQWKNLPGGMVENEALIHIPAPLRRRLAEIPQTDLIEAMRADISNSEVLIDAGVAENLLKIRRITELQMQAENPYENFRSRPIHGYKDRIKGLSPDKIAKLLRGFPEPNDNEFTNKSFNLPAHILAQMSVKYAIDNDKYGFTSPGILFSHGFHKTTEVVYELSSRGNDAWPYIVAGGQDQVIDMLENLHFTDWQIDALKQTINPDFDIDPAYWEYLRTWRFKGKIIGVPVGTVVFPKEPILQIITDPVSALIVESLINPWMSSMTNFLTTATQLMVAKGDIKVLTEAGTRRVITGNLSAYAGLMAGASGTSNVLMAHLMGGKAYGTTQHAFMAGPWLNTYDAAEAFLNSAKKPGLVLPDTHHLQTGMREAIRAGGDHAATFRQDSNATDEKNGQPLSTLETARLIQDIAIELGRPAKGAFVSNDLTLKTLAELASSDLEVDVASVGGGFAAPKTGHGNFVYKVVQFRNRKTGKLFYPIKIADGAKSTWPGEKDLFRIYDSEGKILSGFITLAGEKAPKNGKSLLQTLFNRRGRAIDRAQVGDTSKYIAEQVALLPEAVRDVEATVKSLGDRGIHVEYSQAAKDVRAQAIEDALPKKELRILVVPGSFEPGLDETHITGAQRLIHLFKDPKNPLGFDRVIFVPTGEKPVHAKTYRLSPASRVRIIERKARGISTTVEVWPGEIEAGGAYTTDTLQAIQTRFGSDAKITVALGDDAFWPIASQQHSWKDSEKLLQTYNFVVFQRTEGASTDAALISNERKETEAALTALGFKKRLNAWDGPSGNRIEFFNARVGSLSSTEVRKFYDDQGIAFLEHLGATDTARDRKTKDPYKILPHFFTRLEGNSIENISLADVQEGYDIYLVIPDKVSDLTVSQGRHLKELMDAGANVLFQKEFGILKYRWFGFADPNWVEVINSLSIWKKSNKTESIVRAELANLKHHCVELLQTLEEN